MYLIKQFAGLAGVTVRTLHHYDRLGLLSPQQRNESGYRLYTTNDLVRLERIMVLRYLGLSLREIAEMLLHPNDDRDVFKILETQAIILRERRDGMTRIIRAIEAAGQSLDAAQTTDWKHFQFIIKELSMQENTEWSKKYYSESAQQAIEQRKAEFSPALQEEVSHQWADLFSKIEIAIAAKENPSGPNGRSLAEQWQKLIEGFTGDNPDIQKGLNAMYSDQNNWPEPTRQQYAIKPEIMDFIRKAFGAHG